LHVSIIVKKIFIPAKAGSQLESPAGVSEPDGLFDLRTQHAAFSDAACVQIK